MSEEKKVEGWKLSGKFAITITKEFSNASVSQHYDFETKVYALTRHGGAIFVSLFSDLDPDTITRARSILHELGGIDPHEGKAEDRLKAKNSRKPFGPQPL